MYLTPFMLYYVVRHLVKDQAAVRHVLWAVAFIGAYNGLYGIYTQVTGEILFLDRAVALGPFRYTESLRIMRGLLDSPHVFGLVFSLAIPIDFYLLLKAETPGRRLLAALFLALALGGVFFTYKRTAWIATLASLAVIPIFFPRFRRLLIVLLATAAVAGWLYIDQIERSAVVTERLNEKTDSLNGRLDLWIAAVEYAAEAPWFGHGMGNFQARSGLKSIESNYLWLLVDSGVFGLAPFLLVLFFLFQTGLRLYRARSALLFVERDQVAIFWSILVAYVVSLSTVVMNHEFPHQLFFVAAGALIGSQEAIVRRLAPEQSRPGVAAPAAA
jgi:O-antigen ligase